MKRITIKTLFAIVFCVRLRPSPWHYVLGFAMMLGAFAGIVHAEAVFLASPAVSGSGDFDKVIEYDSITGTIVREFVYSPAPTDWTPTDVALGPDGNLYVASQTRQQADHAEIIKVNLVTGTLSIFATEGIGGIFGITFGPNGNLYASSACGVGSPSCGPNSPKVVEYDGVTGALIGTFIGGLLPPAGGIAFGPNGNLFIGGDGEVVEYNGQTGAIVGTFASQGLSGAVNGLTFAPGGNLIVADTRNGMMEFDGVTGNLIRLIDDDLRAVGVAFDANGFLLASSNELFTPIRKYEWPSGTFLGTYADNPSAPHGITAELPESNITVNSPNGGEEIHATEEYEITWTSEGDIENVKIEYSVNNGADWIQIVESTQNDGLHNWEVPCDLSDESLVRISNMESETFDTSDAVFSIIDDTPPSVTALVDKDHLWPPNHKMVDVGFDYSVTDNCDAEPDISIEVTITSDEPTATAHEAGGPTHAPDAEINDSVLLRAERSGESDGRVYQIVVTATDESSNSVSEAVNVKVNKSKKKEALDSGQFYDATEIN